MLEAALLGGLNHLLEGAPWARTRLAPYAGRLAEFAMPPLRFGLAIGEDGRFAPATATAAEPDVRIALPAFSPLLLAGGSERLMAEAHVTGNAEFATELSFVLRNLRWDVEEDLSRVVGDIAARRIVQTGRACVAAQRQAADNLAANLREYVAHERPAVLGRPEFEEFRNRLRTFEDALARADGWLARLG